MTIITVFLCVHVCTLLWIPDNWRRKGWGVCVCVCVCAQFVLYFVYAAEHSNFLREQYIFSTHSTKWVHTKTTTTTKKPTLTKKKRKETMTLWNCIYWASVCGRGYWPVVNAVLVVDVQQLVLDPGDLLGRLLAPLSLQRILLVDLGQAHHGLLTDPPLRDTQHNKWEM